MEKSRLAKLLWTYGPSLRWREFRLYGHRPNGKWIPVKLTQLIGGQNWSVSICRTGSVRETVQPRVHGVEFGCATCSAEEGQMHQSWCHRQGVMVAPRWASQQ